MQASAWHALSDYQGKWVVLYFYPTGHSELVLADLKQLMAKAPK